MDLVPPARCGHSGRLRSSMSISSSFRSICRLVSRSILTSYASTQRARYRYWLTATSSFRNQPLLCCISPTNIERRGYCRPVSRKGEAYRWMMFAVTELEQPLWRITKQSLLYPEDKRIPADIALAQEEFLAM